jgi:L-aminopeptidase/D-esterase-like protein
VVGRGPVRTGVTVIIPHEGNVWRGPGMGERVRLTDVSCCSDQYSQRGCCTRCTGE